MQDNHTVFSYDAHIHRYPGFVCRPNQSDAFAENMQPRVSLGVLIQFSLSYYRRMCDSLDMAGLNLSSKLQRTMIADC